MLNYPILDRSLRLALVVALLGAARPAAAQQDTTDDGVRARADSAVLADSVNTVTRWLVANGAPEGRARLAAAHIMEFARLRALDPLLVVGVIGVENASLSPRARSRAGARGVMQVMPSWRKDVRGCGNDLQSLRANICLGTAVLRIALDASETVREALLRYNGCVRAPGCGVYASAVFGRAGYALIASRRDSTASPKRAPSGDM